MTDDVDETPTTWARPSQSEFLEGNYHWWTEKKERMASARRLVGNEPHLTAFVEARQFRAKLFSYLKRFLIQCGALLAAAATFTEIWDFIQKWPSHK